MLTNKLIVIISILLTSFSSYAQPSLEPESMVGVFLELKGHEGEKLYFNTSDSLHFISDNETYHFHVNILTKYVDTVSRITPFYLGILKESGACVSNQKNVVEGSCFTYTDEKKLYRLVYPFLKTSLLYRDLFIYKSILELNFFHNSKNMKVFIDFTDREEEFLKSDIAISFQEGIFEITDPTNPKLIPIKE